MSTSNNSLYLDSPKKYAAWHVLYTLMGLVTGSLLFPLSMYLSAKRSAKYTIIDGKKLVFKGKISTAYLLYFKWIFLSIVTLFIYTFLIPTQTRKWIVGNTYFEDEVIEGSSNYKGNGMQSLVVSIVLFVTKLFTLWLYSPKTSAIYDEIVIRRAVISGHFIIYADNFKGILKLGYKNTILKVITLGFYKHWEQFYVNKRRIKFMHIDVGQPVVTASSKIYDAIDFFLSHKVITLIVFISFCSLCAIGLVVLFYVIHGNLAGLITTIVVLWLFIYNSLFKTN